MQPGLGFVQPAWLAEQQVDRPARIDVDGDGELDLVVLHRVDYPAAYDVVLVEPDGRGGERGRTLVRSYGPDPWWDYAPEAAVDARDVNGEGVTDLTVIWTTFFMTSEAELSPGRPEGGYGPPQRTNAPGRFVGAGDFDRDGRDESLTTWTWAMTGLSRLVHEDGTGWVSAGNVNLPYRALEPRIGDLDRDGDDDVLVRVDFGRVAVVLGDAIRPLARSYQPQLSPARPSGVLLMPTADGGHDLLAFNWDSGRPALKLQRYRLAGWLVEAWLTRSTGER